MGNALALVTQLFRIRTYNSQTNVHYENSIYSHCIIQAGNVWGRVFVCGYYYN